MCACIWFLFFPVCLSSIVYRCVMMCRACVRVWCREWSQNSWTQQWKTIFARLCCVYVKCSLLSHLFHFILHTVQILIHIRIKIIAGLFLIFGCCCFFLRSYPIWNWFCRLWRSDQSIPLQLNIKIHHNLLNHLICFENQSSYFWGEFRLSLNFFLLLSLNPNEMRIWNISILIHSPESPKCQSK